MTDRRDKSGPWDKDEYVPWTLMDRDYGIGFYPYGQNSDYASRIYHHSIVVSAIENMMAVRI